MNSHASGTTIRPDHTAPILLMLAAAGLIACTMVLAKWLSIDGQGGAGLHPFQVSAGRFVFALATLVAFIALSPQTRPTLTNANWRLHLLRSLCGWLGVSATFGAVAMMPVAEATAISFLSPLVAMGLAVVMLGEHLGYRKILSAGLAMAGAALVLKPGTDAFQLAGLLALGAAGFMGLEAIFIKQLSDTEPALRVLLINNTIGACVSATVALRFWVAPSPFQWGLLAAIGTIMVLGQALFIQAMKRGQASLVMPAFYSVLLFSGLYDYALFNVAPGWLSVIGGVLIVMAATILARTTNSR